MQRRWAQFTDGFAPAIDGVATVVDGYASTLQQHGGCVVVAPKEPKYKDVKDYRVIRVPSVKTHKKIGYRVASPIEVRVVAELKKMPIALVHCHSPFSLSFLAESAAKACKVPSIITYHTKYAQDIERSVPAPFRELVADFVVQRYKTFDEVWTVSRGAAADLRQLGFKGGVVVMPNGCSMSTAPVDERLVRQVNDRHGLQPDVPVLLFVGRMIWYKGIDMILHTLAEMKKAGAAFRMLFVGDGSDSKDIQATAHSMALDDCVAFVGKVADRELLRAYYARADLFYFPSTFDTSGLVVQEAAALGCPSAALRDTCVAEAMVDGRNGLLVGDDPQAAAADLLALLRQPERLKALGEAARHEVYISWDVAMRNVMARYEQVLAHSRRVKKTRRVTGGKT